MSEVEKTTPRLTVKYSDLKSEFYCTVNPNPTPIIGAKAASFADRVMLASGPTYPGLPGYSKAPTVVYSWPFAGAAPERISRGVVSAAILLPLVFMVTIFGLLPFLRRLLDFSLGNFPLIVVQSVVFLSILTVGVLLYRMRCRRRMMYGVTECLVGIAMAAYYANYLKPEDPTQTFALLGALYIIVRGMDNIHNAPKSNKFERRWNRMFFGQHAPPTT